MVYDDYSNVGILRSYTFYHDLLQNIWVIPVHIFGLMIVRAHLALKRVVVGISINLPV